MRVIVRFVICVAAWLLLIGPSPASAGGSWMYGEWDRYEPGETVTMVGYFGWGQQGWLEDGPFFANVRPAMRSETDRPPTVLTAPVQFSNKVLQMSFGALEQVRIETTFVLPADLPPGQYMVAVCNVGCKKGIGDLVGGPLPVGVDAEWAFNRGWPEDDPSFPRSQAQPADRRGVDPGPVASTAAVVTTIAPRTTVPTTTVAATAASAVLHESQPAAASTHSANRWPWVIPTIAAVMAIGGAGVLVRRRATRLDEPVLSASEERVLVSAERD